MQSDVVLQEFGAVAGLRSLVLCGGVPEYTQVAELKKKYVDCLAATPGRIKDLAMDGSCDLSKVEAVRRTLSTAMTSLKGLIES
jgi:superfamily II DNA/RNA helicase